MSLLSALLTQDHVVSPKAIGEAIERQVINGGDFETNLLELNAIGEDTLAAYSAAILGVTPATREDVLAADPTAIAKVPASVAARTQTLPLYTEGGQLVLASAAALAPEARAELEGIARMPLSPRYVTLVRLAWGLWRYYQVPLAPRLARLAQRLEAVAPGHVPEDITIPLTRPRVGSRASSISSPAVSALAALDRALHDDSEAPRAASTALPPVPLAARTAPPPVFATEPLPYNVNRRTNTPPLPMPAATAVAPETPTIPSPPPTVSTPPREPDAPVRAAIVPDVAIPSRPAGFGARARASSDVVEPVRPSRPSATELTPVAPVSRPSATGLAPVAPVSRPSVTELAPVAPVSRPSVTEAPAATPAPPERPSMVQPRATAASSPAVRPPAAPERPAPRTVSSPSIPLPRPPTTARASGIAPVRHDPPPERVTTPPVESAPESVPTPMGGMPLALPPRNATPPPPVVTPTEPPAPVPSLPPPALELVMPSEPPPPMASSARGISLDEAARRLDVAEDRDAVVEAMLAHVHGRFAYAALFVVQGETFAGLSSVGVGLAGAALRAQMVPLASTSILRTAHDTGGLEVTRVEPGTPDAALRHALGRDEADEVVAVPLRIGAKVALVLWADDGARAPTALSVRELDAFVRRCAAAFERLIAARRRPAGRGSLGRLELPSARPSDRVPLPDRGRRLEALRNALGSTPPSDPRPTPAPVFSSAPAPRPAQSLPTDAPERAPRPTPLRSPSDVCDGLVQEMVDAGEAPASAVETLVEHGEAGLDALFRRFPGPLRVKRHEALARLPSAEAAGPVVRATVAFRHAALTRLTRALDSADADARYCALVCLAEVVHPASVAAIAPKLTDPDYPTRMAAVEVLRVYRRFDEFEVVGRTLRATLGDRAMPPEQRRAAAYALGELRDVEAVPALVAALDEPDAALATSAHRALCLVTRQDFGTAPGAWTEWYGRAGRAHRVEWLVEALLHPEPTIRHEASEELKRVTGQFFGYYFNLPRRERERAHQRYVEWWRAEGEARFRGQRV